MIKWLKEKKSQNRLRFFTYMVYTILVIILLGLFVFIFSMIDFSNKGLDESFIFNKRPTIIITGSMEPTVKINSVVMIEPVKFEDLEIGDIIRYQSDKGYSILHRVIQKNVSYVVTKGDANEKADTFAVISDQITGRVAEIHNEFADPLTFLFGQFDYANPSNFALRMFFVFFILAFILFLSIACFIVIFESITTTYFFKKYNVDLVENSAYWVNQNLNLDEQKEIVKEYLLYYANSNIFRKIILAIKFRKYYNGLINIEKEVLKTNKRLKSLMKSEK